VKKPVLVQQNQIKTGLEIKQKVFRKKNQVKVGQHHVENQVKNVIIKRKPMYVFRRLTSNH
jgi:hypothetical protein